MEAVFFPKYFTQHFSSLLPVSAGFLHGLLFNYEGGGNIFVQI
jgi:hypothetical protein